MTICDCNQGRLPCSCKNPLTGDGDDTIQFQLDAAQSELAALREELADAQRVLSFSGNEADAHSTAALHTELEETQQRLTAAKQRNAELTQALERGKMWAGQYRAWYGDSGVVAEDHLMIIRTLKGLPHPPTEFDKPTESGASE